jgi:2-polyprenyl-6-methoxyphenol hydroxylase-like FAD-dependent oxidoreductase
MTPILIVGAGPTGLVLALWLTKIGIKIRIIDKAAKAGTTSRALVVHARTLEFYRQLGISEEVTEKGFKFPNVNLWVGDEKKATLQISEIGKGSTPCPYIFIFPQDQHEELLISKLKELGVKVERSTELISTENLEDRVRSKIKLANGSEEVFESQFVAGCDGARSEVRHQMGVEFAGSTYPNWFYVADIVGTGPVMDGELHVSLDKAEFMAIFPLKEKGTARLIGVIRTEGDGSKSTWEDVNPRLINELKINVKKVNWFSTYHVHHRVASHFQKGRIFILGDASHIHSPVGGQGMNTGIGDAVNLAWKLGEVINQRAPIEILKTYEIERIAFAKRLVNTTDQAFTFVTAQGKLAQFVRTKLVPTILPPQMKFEAARKFMFRTVSQVGITYRHCSFNKGEAGKLKGGDRLPWVGSVDNFATLKNLSWQVHVYGDKEIEGIKAILFPWNSEMHEKGLVKDAAYVVRPDGYIGFISEPADAGAIQDYLKQRF